MMSRTLLIDGDIFSRRYTAAAEYELYTIVDETGEFVDVRTKTKANAFLADYPDNPDVKIVHKELVVDPFGRVANNIQYAIDDMRNAWHTSHMMVFIKGADNFREKIYPAYKIKRKNKPKPTHYEEAVAHLKRIYHAIVCDGAEADDFITIAATQEPNSVICSNDKDLKQMHGTHYNFVTRETEQVSKRGGDLSLFRQVLAGDPTDDIPGIPGVGMAKATKILEGVRNREEAYERCVKAYQGDVGHMHLMANLVFLWRQPGDSFESYMERSREKSA